MFKKAQISSLDLLFASGVFLFILLSSLLLWRMADERTAALEDRSVMEYKAEVAMMSLLLHSGDPYNWYAQQDSAIFSLGLSSGGDYVLDPQKLQGLVGKNSSYVNISQALGLPGLEVSLRVVNGSGTAYSFGMLPSSRAIHVVQVERLALLEGEPVQVILEVWDHA